MRERKHKIGEVVAKVPRSTRDIFDEMKKMQESAHGMLVSAQMRNEDLWETLAEEYDLDTDNIVYRFNRKDGTIEAINYQFDDD